MAGSTAVPSIEAALLIHDVCPASEEPELGGVFRVREQTPDRHQYTQPLCNTCEDIPLREEIMFGKALVFCGFVPVP